jgi:hypothetical protein
MRPDEMACCAPNDMSTFEKLDRICGMADELYSLNSNTQDKLFDLRPKEPCTTGVNMPQPCKPCIDEMIDKIGQKISDIISIARETDRRL